jgi:hypothetical protein
MMGKLFAIRALPLRIKNVASDLGQAVQRLGPVRINIIGVIVGGVGDNLYLLVRYILIVGERQRCDV